MFEIRLNNNKIFECDKTSSILEAAKNHGIVLEHSCLSARCRSCMVKVVEGEVEDVLDEMVLSESEKKEGFTLSCNARPLSNLRLDIDDLGDVVLSEPRTLACKIDYIEKVSDDVIRLILRFPPSIIFNFLSGQYVNIIKGSIRRSYSIANNPREDSKLEFFIKKYENGLMSDYLFNEAKKDDLLRIQGPLGTFFHREKESMENIVFLATGTGIAPVKAILEELYFKKTVERNKIWIFWGVRKPEDFFWEPKFAHENIKFIKVISREDDAWTGERGYVQNVLIKKGIPLKKTQIYACGSNAMITSASSLLQANGLLEQEFYSDAFVSSN